MKWREVKISLFCQTGSGGTPFTQDKAIYYGGDIPWVKSGELKDDILLSTEESITEKGLEESSAKWVPSGAVLIAMYGATVGRTAFLGIDAATNQAVCSVVPDPKVAYNKYVWYALRTKVTEFLSRRVGGAQPNINQKIIRDTQVVLPTISEQRRIVEILDQADILRKKRAEADAKAEQILPALFYKRFGDPAININISKHTSIRAVVSKIERRDPSDSPDTPFKYIDIAGIDGTKGRIAQIKTLYGVDAPGRARQIVKTNDVLISTVRPYLRATALVPAGLDDQICSTGFCVLRAKNGIGFGYLYTLSRLEWFTKRLNESARGASYPAVTDNDILDLQVPYPSDKNILTKCDGLVSQLNAIEEKRLLLIDKLDNLFDLLLVKAFSGDLTAKWRETHMKELLAEMEEQTKYLELSRMENV
ncbi:MAG: restriction endonuclease subunit S [Nitrospirae bacterium]|nr:restriction endonuclease subunit S [Nitrospirota bacterium]